MRNLHGALRKLAEAHPFFSGLHVSTVSSQLPPALFGTQRWQSRASPENQEIERRLQNKFCHNVAEMYFGTK